MKGSKLYLAILASAGMVAATAAQGASASTAGTFSTAGVSTAVAFHSHPLVPAPGSTNSVQTTGFIQEPYWSGYEISGAPGHVNSAAGCWTVPAITAPSSGVAFASQWVGIDGFGYDYLIQTGTEEEWYSSSPDYVAWWEIITPTDEAPATPIGGVNPGDAICASITRGGSDSTISITDETADQQFSTVQAYSGPGATVEWILEAPFVSGPDFTCGPCPLANYGQTNLDPVSVNGGNPDLGPSSGLEMNEGSGVVSVPSNPDSDANGFTVAYGSTQPPPPPAALSVSPPSGSVAGGETVTIGGSGFERGATVAFGSTLASGVQYVSPTQLTAVTPAEAVGTVSVTVTNPTGPSSTEPSAYSYAAGGGYTLDGFGGVHPFGDSPPVTTTGYWPGWTIAQSIQMDPCDTGDQISGWVMDGFGGLHPFAAAGTPMPAVPYTTGYWPGWTIANDFTAFCITVNNVQHAAGCVLDGFGGLHAWADSSAVIGDVPCNGSGYWPGWDIATKIAVIPGTDQGYVMDGFGGLHPFNGAPNYAPSGYWPGWEIASDLVATANGGYTIDGFGGIHPFGSAPSISPSGYWPGWDIARAVTSAWTGTTGGVFVLDGFGGVHPAGGAAYFDTCAYWPGWSIAIGVVSAP